MTNGSIVARGFGATVNALATCDDTFVQRLIDEFALD